MCLESITAHEYWTGQRPKHFGVPSALDEFPVLRSPMHLLNMTGESL